MKVNSFRQFIKICSVIWLFVVTPIFGIFPMLLLLQIPIPRYVLFIGLAILREMICLFIADPEPYTNDVGPPLTKLGYIIMISIVFSLASFSLYFLYNESHKFRQKYNSK